MRRHSSSRCGRKRPARAALVALLSQLTPRFGPQAFQMAALVEPSHPLPERRSNWQVFA